VSSFISRGAAHAALFVCIQHEVQAASSSHENTHLQRRAVRFLDRFVDPPQLTALRVFEVLKAGVGAVNALSRRGERSIVPDQG